MKNMLVAIFVCSLLLLVGCTSKETTPATSEEKGITTPAVSSNNQVKVESNTANANDAKIRESVSRLSDIVYELQTFQADSTENLSKYNVFNGKEECSTFMALNDENLRIAREIHARSINEQYNLALLLGENNECLNAIKTHDANSLKYSTANRNAYKTFASYCGSSDSVLSEQAKVLYNSIQASDAEYSSSYDEVIEACPKLVEETS